jgi:hypothetical protein
MKGAVAPDTTTSTSVQGAAQSRMVLKAALEHRRSNPTTPYIAEAWDKELKNASLLPRFTKIPQGICNGFILNFPTIHNTQAPANSNSVYTYKSHFNASIQKKIQKSRYIGPFSAQSLMELIGPFQSSPLSIIPKPGNTDKFRLIQNFSFPRNTKFPHHNPSINSHIDANDFPTTWGKFSIIYLLILRLPPGSEVATRDIAEAYCTIPLHPSQWPAAIVRTANDEFYIDTCTAFRATPSAGAYGHIADAGAEILRY